MSRPLIDRISILRSVLFLAVFSVHSQLYAQIDAEVSVEITEENGIYTYDYTVANSFLSSLSANSFLLTVGKGENVVIPLPDNDLDPLQGRRLSAPENWVGVYQPHLVQPPCNPTELGSLAADFQVAWAAGDGITTPASDEFDILQGESMAFSLVSRWAPEVKEYLVGKLTPAECEDTEFAGLVFGEVEVPSIAPETPSLACDFDGDGDCDLVDIDLLSAETATGSNTPLFDLNSDALVDIADINAFLADQSVNKPNGDSDFNGLVEFADFLTLANNFEQETTWSGGDFDGSGFVQFADFLIIANNFGKGTVEGVTGVVPEPSSFVQVASILCCLFAVRRSRTG